MEEVSQVLSEAISETDSSSSDSSDTSLLPHSNIQSSFQLRALFRKNVSLHVSNNKTQFQFTNNNYE